MKFIIKHEVKGRLRFHVCGPQMTRRQAGILYYYVSNLDNVTGVKVYERTGDCAVTFDDSVSGARNSLIKTISEFSYDMVDLSDKELDQVGDRVNADYRDRLLEHVTRRVLTRIFLPAPLRYAYTTIQSLSFIKKGLVCLRHGKLQVPVLDATAITVSILRGDFNTAGSVMFLLGFGDIIEEWTHKRSVDNLAKAMDLNIGTVWKKDGDQEIAVKYNEIQTGDEVVVRVGSQIPYDGVVTAGEGMVNQSSMTGESKPVPKKIDSYVYAGTVIEEGTLTIKVKEASGSTRYEKIIKMIEDGEKLKSEAEDKASHLADKLVPYMFLGTGLVYLLTGNTTKALSVLMVDFSCALKLAMPITVLSAITEASRHNISVKGGKFLEAVAEADTIVFDKTGTLTNATPTLRDVVSFSDRSKDECLRIAACLEEHFPHSIANAVVNAAIEKGLEHREMHSKVEYIVAHGIASYIGDKRIVIGSHHFVFEDEKCRLPEGCEEKFEALPDDCSHLYMVIEGQLDAVLLIEDPLRPEAVDTVKALRDAGFTNIVMMTGDSDRTAKAIARKVGVDKYYSEVLPEDKARFVEKAKEGGHKVLMVGDGINDSPALSAADAAVAISDGSAIAREIADITISGSDLDELITLRKLSELMMKKINKNYKVIMTVNSALIALGVFGVLQPTTSALLHNGTTLALSIYSTKHLLPDEIGDEASAEAGCTDAAVAGAQSGLAAAAV